MEAKKKLLLDYGGEIKRIEFKEAYEIYLRDMEGENTVDNIKNKKTYGKRFESHFRGHYLDQITQIDIQRYKTNRKRAETHSTGTIDLELGTLKHLFGWAIAHGYTKTNPAKEIKKFNDDYRRGVVMTHEQARRLLETADPELKLRLLLALVYGLRHGEIAGIKKEDVDLLNKTITIYRLKKKHSKKSVLQIPDEIVQMIKDLPPGVGNRAVYVFPKKDCEKRFKSALIRAGIDPKTFRFHDLRHTAASWQLEQGTNLETIRMFLGHSDIQTTSRYLHVDDREVHVAASKTLKTLL
ncbi:MAG TPA: tyrosine-type recombinase/integrase [bacterium]|nr:tyrosine-type recombinase/integrase [bacterium]